MKRLTKCKGSATPGSQTLGTPSHQSHCCLNNTIDDLPPCLLVEVLCRLPCKFVIRCNCVCKSWSTLISDPYFDSRRALYLRNNNCDNQQVPLFVDLCGYIPRKPQLYTIKYSYPQMKIKPLDLRLISFAQSNEVVVAATYNDLILFCRRRSASSSYYICNPFTKQWVFIPPPPRHQLIANEGFSLDLDNNCCKVVRILKYFVQIGTSHTLLMVEIFSFETGKWIESDVVLQGSEPDHVYYGEYIDGQVSPVAHNGTLYWMTSVGHLIGLELFRSTYCRGRFIYNPNYLRRSYFNRGSTLCVCQGSVRLGQLYEKPASAVCLYISELKEDDDDEVDGGGSKLCLRELVDLQPFITSFPMMRNHHLLAFDPKDEDIVYLWHGDDYSSNYPGAVLRCNISRHMTHIYNKSPSSNYPLKSFSFVLPRWRWPTPVPQLPQRHLA